tara:strand:- start:69896 stop:70489 length:594 start_codon:yes stop_codon:yes gene_type:complete
MQEAASFINTISFNWNLLESIAVLFSLAYVILAAYENILCWTASLISVIIYTYICYTSMLLGETYLQIFYLFMTFYGFLKWNSKEDYNIKTWNEKKHLITILIGSIFTFFLGYFLSEYTNSEMPIVDSFTTVFSIIATYLVVKKILGNWLYWIVIDVTSIYLYYNRDLHLTCLLFLLYAIIATIGYANWTKKINANV